MRSSLRCFLALLVVLLLAGCTKTSNRKNYTVSEPSKQDLAGTYLPTEGTVKLIVATGRYENKPASIILEADGGLKIANLPDCWLSPYGASRGLLDTGAGSWNLVRNQQWWVLMCSFPSLSNHAGTEGKSGKVTAVFSLVGQKPPYTLETLISHPDAELIMHFEKM